MAKSKQLLEEIEQQRNEDLDQLYKEEMAGFSETEKYMNDIIAEARELGIDTEDMDFDEIGSAILKARLKQHD